MQTDNRVLDGMARLFTNAAGAAQSFKTEMETIVKARMERLVAEMDLVPREEFDAVKAMAAKARAENEKLAARIAALETASGKTPGGGARKVNKMPSKGRRKPSGTR